MSSTRRADAIRALRDSSSRDDLDVRLGNDIREIGLASDDLLAVQMLYAVAGQSGSHRIVLLMRAIQAWLADGGGK